MKQKLAPNVKALPKDKNTEAVIIAGVDAWVFAKDWQENNQAWDTVPPVTLGPKQLVELDSLRIIDKGRRFVRVNRAGTLAPLQISTIATKLAQAGVTEARFFSEAQELLEDWTPQLPRLREEAERGETIEVLLAREAGGQTPADELAPRVEERADGLYWVTPKLDKVSGEIIRPGQWLCDGLTIAGIGVEDSERYLVLRWHPAGGGREHTEAVPMRDIGEREGWARLRAGGLSVTAKSGLRAILADYLSRSSHGQVWTITSATGWQNGAYIMPDGSVIGEPASPVIFNGRSGAARGYATSGTPESWRDHVAALASGNPSMVLGVACALAAPLIGLVGADGFGVHLFGGSSAGKTTTGNMASSVYGEPEALKLTWYSTALGLVNEAAAHNDGLMPLDEIGQGSNRRAVAESAYALFNGVGKLQGAKEGGNRELKRWRAMAFSTGEIDLESYIRADGGKVNAGQLVRLLNIPISKATAFHGLPDGKAHADALRDACRAHYGTVGRAWIAFLAGHKQDAIDAYRQAERRWLALLPDDAGEQVRRVASRFAVLEAALVLSAGLTGWDEQESRDALQHGFNAWVSEFGMGNREHKQIVEQAEEFLNAYGMSRFAPVNYDPRDLPISELMGYRDNGERFDDPMLFYVLPAPFKKHVAGGHNKDAAARILYESGMLKRPASGKNWQIRTPRLKHLNNARPWTYVLFFAPEPGESEAE